MKPYGTLGQEEWKWRWLEMGAPEGRKVSCSLRRVYVCLHLSLSHMSFVLIFGDNYIMHLMHVNVICIGIARTLCLC